VSAPRALDEEGWASLVEFYAEGHTYRECAVRFGVSLSTVARHFKEHPEIPRRKPREACRLDTAERSRDPSVLREFLEKQAVGELRAKANHKPAPASKKRAIVELEEY
jgi:transposase